MRTSKEWMRPMREDTWHFEVEVLRIYGRQELWSHGFGARPRASEKKRFDHKSNFPLFDLSPEKDLQHRLEVLALATDGEESCPMEGRPFQRLQAQRRGVAMEVEVDVGSQVVLPLPLVGGSRPLAYDTNKTRRAEASFGPAGDDNGRRYEPPPQDRIGLATAVVPSRRRPPAAPGKPSFPYFKVYYLPRRCVLAEPSQRTSDIESPRLDGVRKIRRQGLKPPESGDLSPPTRVDEDGFLRCRLAVGTILAVEVGIQKASGIGLCLEASYDDGGPMDNDMFMADTEDTTGLPALSMGT
ncbi:hypothetical protein THAOC_35350 [Thalassiosira oceanica]|uniref:DUF6743 domain-containing protein n=1 Tax=Thalassiosira oceanica TaxID=159749 RepID=K0R120_THAOC|nr:hypothetical protein THAOC_35350 [Thalassiosira oceanica]|eukprot:EJK46008.1 hypothetical protein THAOC_35350 [Thalassiosira oceanica]